MHQGPRTVRTTVADRWTVTTTTGRIRGHAVNHGVAFRGIPYAEPPVGDLRLRRARPKTPWDGTFVADRPGEYCSQWRDARHGRIGSEDCLWLNVVVPHGAPRDGDEQRPVVVYLHGGSNIHGSAREPLLSGEYFANATDAVYVAVNYRLGMLGQLALGHADGLDTDRFETNAGLSDIVTAVEWVHANAQAFGGAPSRITVMGESSGGAMVTALSASPRMDGLVAGFIAQSPAGAMVHSPAQAGQLSDAALELLATRTDASPLDADHRDLAWLTEKLNAASWGAAGIAGAFAPVVDDLLPRHPLEPGAQLDVPLLVGTNLDEYVLMRWNRVSRRTLQGQTCDFAGLIDDERGPDVLSTFYSGGRRRGDAGRFVGDALFTAPSMRLADQHPSGRAWMYRLDLTTPSLNISGIGATHALDLPILFGRYDSGRGPGALALGGRDRMSATTAVMQQRWREFIHRGDPGWTPYRDGFATQVFDAGEETVDDPVPELREAWSRVRLTG
ncbi:carboxylesterase family protein [Corynebacterium sp. AOP12-C2-36]|uniref:carboxylesterase family protein n=1 Tax=Corynebacterium sp. AOP12-C2-36 TaxID=3457723 RepID=UPI004034E7F7